MTIFPFKRLDLLAKVIFRFAYRSLHPIILKESRFLCTVIIRKVVLYIKLILSQHIIFR